MRQTKKYLNNNNKKKRKSKKKLCKGETDEVRRMRKLLIHVRKQNKTKKNKIKK